MGVDHRVQGWRFALPLATLMDPSGVIRAHDRARPRLDPTLPRLIAAGIDHEEAHLSAKTWTCHHTPRGVEQTDDRMRSSGES